MTARLYAAIPALGCLFAAVISPVILLFGSAGASEDDAGRIENKSFWLLLALLCVALGLRRLERVRLGPNLVWLGLYLALAGASSFWAVAGDTSLKRSMQQVLIVLCMVAPVVTAERRDLIWRAVFACLATAVLLNAAALALRPTTAYGHPGIYESKNTLGLVAALALMLAFHELSLRNKARALPALIAVLSLAQLVLSQSKTSLALAMGCPLVAGLLVGLSRLSRVPLSGMLAYLVALACLVIALCSAMFDLSAGDWLQMVFGDRTLTGRTTIWAFAADMIERRPLLGWGYQSFWMIGPEGPSMREGPGFVSQMPHAHNGYLDTLLESGWVGLTLMVAFLLASLRAVGRVEDARRAWLLLSLILFSVFYNGTETTLGRAFTLEWLVLLIACADAGAGAAWARAAERRLRVSPAFIPQG